MNFFDVGLCFWVMGIFVCLIFFFFLVLCSGFFEKLGVGWEFCVVLLDLVWVLGDLGMD